MDIVTFWKECELGEPPFAHPEDRETLRLYGRHRDGRSVLDLDHLNFAAYVSSARFCPAYDRHFHLSLMPVPYTGCLAKAKIFVLGLNPGFNVTDYYAEYCVPNFIDQLKANLRQESLSEEFPFLYLDPQFCWHSGFAWWERKFRDIATLLAMKRERPYREILSEISKRVAAIELVPYHSISFPYGKRMRRLLPSSQYARDFARKELLPRVNKGEVVLIVTRAVKDWALPQQKSENVVVCPNPQNVSFAVQSQAGKAILLRLGIDPEKI